MKRNVNDCHDSHCLYPVIFDTGNNLFSIVSQRDEPSIRSTDLLTTLVLPRLSSSRSFIRAGSRILPRKRRHFRSPVPRDRQDLSSGTVGLTLTEQGPGRYSRSCLLGSAGTTFRAASLVQLSTLKSSLWRAGNSRCGCDRLNFASASMCSSEISRSCGIFARIASHTVTSPLIGVTWFRSSSDLNALITACDSLLMSPRHFSPGRSAQGTVSQ